MINSLSTPQDIVEAIIEIADYDTLLQCALVSQSFLFPSRKMLFSDIVLQNEMQSDRLQRILVQNPYIQSFIKSLTILNKEDGEGPHQWLTGKRSISALLATLHLPLHHMASFSLISSPFPIYWSYLHDTLKSALRNIFCSPSLTKLRISGFQDIPIPFLFHLNHIQDLVLDETCMLIIPIPVHDFPRIPGLGSGAEHVSDAATERFAWKMRHVGFYILVSKDISPLPFMTYARTIELHGVIKLKAGTGPLYLMLRTLDCSLRSPATLEYLSVKIEPFDKNNEWSESNIWNEMDSILTRPTCSRLRKVRIIPVIISEAQSDAMGNVEALISPLLPLLHAKGILVVEKAIVTNEVINPYRIRE